ncbi:hypothetical protein MIMGU_mgv1a021866mg [Erythranthe guttata]|uniref:Cation/H+ exchanger transmembrane domain-containing protein n=1 Tax=Erythranthe guttata TaxID=4155 RepID=A0A022RK31_ERYGU|nr:hypothetical protein MIMGU_mgv1a021866mg [Erythranthe guttata]
MKFIIVLVVLNGVVSWLMRIGESKPDSAQDPVDNLAMFIILLCACIITRHQLKGFRWINGPIIAISFHAFRSHLGLGTGITLLVLTGGKSSNILVFDVELFFTYFLPPVIFNAGLQVKKEHFFKNLMNIMLFGAFGTLISFFITSFGSKLYFETLGIGNFDLNDYLAIGAIFSATDSICTLQVLNQDELPLLYSLVFGEGVVNDATYVVLFNAIQKFDLSDINAMIFFNTQLGVTLSAYIIKKLNFRRDSAYHLLALMILMAYLSYILLFEFGGILTVFIYGIVMSHYILYNVNTLSRVTAMHAFATMSVIAERVIYIYLGMDALDIEKWKVVSKSPVGTSSLMLSLVMLGRASFVFPLSFLSNLLTKIWLVPTFGKSGDDNKQQANVIMITCTITVVMFSTVDFGSLTTYLIRLTLPLSDFENNTHSSEPRSPSSSTINILPFLSNYTIQDLEEDDRISSRNISRLVLFLCSPYNSVHYYWRKLDNAFMRRVFGGRGFTVHFTSSTEETLDHSLLV